jgi:hypothetical protein
MEFYPGLKVEEIRVSELRGVSVQERWPSNSKGDRLG